MGREHGYISVDDDGNVTAYRSVDPGTPVRLAAGSGLPDWWDVDDSPQTLTLQDGQLVVETIPGQPGVVVNENDQSRAFGNGYSLNDAFGHNMLAVYSQKYPLDITRREGVIEMYAHATADGAFTGGGMQFFGGGNFAAQSDSSIVYPIYWVDGDTVQEDLPAQARPGCRSSGEKAPRCPTPTSASGASASGSIRPTARRS